MLILPRCSRCNAPLPPSKAGRGRPRVYCSDACRKSACRERRVDGETVLVGQIARGKVPLPIAASTDEQVARVILEARGIAASFLRLGHIARPAFAWRCENVGLAIVAALDMQFEGADRG